MLIKSIMLQQLQRSSSDTALTLRDKKKQQFWHVYDCPVTERNILVWHNLAASSKLFSLSSSQPHTHTVSLFLSLSFTYSHISVSPGPRLSERGRHNFIIHCILPLARFQLKKKTLSKHRTADVCFSLGHEAWEEPLVLDQTPQVQSTLPILDLWGQNMSRNHLLKSSYFHEEYYNIIFWGWM